MKGPQAVDFHLQYHKANSKKNTLQTCEFVLYRFTARFGQRDLERPGRRLVQVFPELPAGRQ